MQLPLQAGEVDDQQKIGSPQRRLGGTVPVWGKTNTNTKQNTKAVLVWVNSRKIQKAALNGASTLADSIALLVKLFEHCQLSTSCSAFFLPVTLEGLWLCWTYSMIAFIFPLHNCFSIEWYSLGPDLAELAGKEFTGTGGCIFCTCPSLHSQWLTLMHWCSFCWSLCWCWWYRRFCQRIWCWLRDGSGDIWFKLLQTSNKWIIYFKLTIQGL